MGCATFAWHTRKYDNATHGSVSIWDVCSATKECLVELERRDFSMHMWNIRVIATAFALGEYPAGRMFDESYHPIAGPYAGAFSDLRGVWKWQEEALSLFFNDLDLGILQSIIPARLLDLTDRFLAAHVDYKGWCNRRNERACPRFIDPKWCKDGDFPSIAQQNAKGHQTRMMQYWLFEVKKGHQTRGCSTSPGALYIAGQDLALRALNPRSCSMSPFRKLVKEAAESGPHGKMRLALLIRGARCIHHLSNLMRSAGKMAGSSMPLIWKRCKAVLRVQWCVLMHWRWRLS